MEETIVLEEQKGLWIEERWLRQARLRGALEVVVGEGEIRILPAVSVSPRFTIGGKGATCSQSTCPTAQINKSHELPRKREK